MNLATTALAAGPEPLLAGFAPLLAPLSGLPWREAMMLASPLVGTALLRRAPRR